MQTIYAVEFIDGKAIPAPLPLGAGHRPLWISSSGRPGENPSHPDGHLQPGAVASDGLHLSITRPPNATQSPVILCGITGPELQAVEVAAVYSAEVGPTGPTDLWAVTLVGRDGPLGPDLNNHHVGATCQTRDGGLLALGAANAINVSPPAKSEEIPYSQAFPPHILPKWFKLKARYDRGENVGEAFLTTTGHQWHTRTWNFPVGMGPITLLGVGVAIASGAGQASVIVHGFEVSTL